MTSEPPSQNFSLYTSLTSSRTPTVPEYPVAELIKHLIIAGGYEVCSPAYQRFTLSSYYFLSLSRDLRDTINGLVHKVDTSSDEDAWISFEEYTDLVDPTEDALLDFLSVIERELKWLGDETEGAFESMEDYSTWIDQWAKNRTELREALRVVTKHSKSEPQSPETYLDSLMRQDTNAFMQYLYRRTELAVNDLKKKKLLSPDAASGILEGLKDIRNDMEKTSFDGLTADRSAGTGLMVARGMEVANEKGYPPSETFLEALKKVIELLGQLIRKEIGPATFDESLTQFRNTAKEKGKPVTYRYIELVRLVRDIRRPYYGRASVLVKLFRAATERLNGNGSTDLESEYNHVLELSKTAMTSSIESMKRIVLATDQLPDADKTALELKFNVAETKLKNKLTPEEIQSWESKFTAAQRTDINHMERFRKALRADRTPPTQHSQETMGIKVSVVKNGKKLPSFTCTINKDMRMTTFLWHIATNCDQDREQVMRNPVFKNSKNAIIDMDLEVKHPSVGTEVTLEI